MRSGAPPSPPITSGLAAHAPAHSVPAGHGNADTSTLPASSSSGAVVLGRLVEIEHHRAEPGVPDGERYRQQHPLVGFAGQPAQPLRYLDIGDAEDARLAELLQQADCAQCLQRGHDPAPVRTSDAATTNGAGGCHVKTPGIDPSANLTSAPHMPRRNRYSTPPRCRSG